MSPGLRVSPGLRARLEALPRHSWRQDGQVPPFPDTRALIVFDGVCVLCSGFARFVAARDPQGQFLFTAAQSPLGQGLFRHLGLDPVNYETNLLLAEGRVFAKMAAFGGIMARLDRPWRLGAAVDGLPAALADGLYDRIARNRYRLFGRRDACILPDAGWRDRVIE